MTQTGTRATVRDLARVAGVSLATVDRVLNGRPGVRPATVERVEAAIAAIGFRRDLGASLLARARPLHVTFLVPSGTNRFMAHLADAVQDAGRVARSERAEFVLERVPAMDPGALALALDALDPQVCDAVAVVAIDDARVTTAAQATRARGIKVIALVSDLPQNSRDAFVGIDNRAAGRTAASLIGRFCSRGGTVGLVAGSLELRDHRARLEGFRAALSEDFPDLAIAGPLEGGDAYAPTRDAVAALVSGTPELVAIYNAGAGNAGLVAALEAAGCGGRMRVVTHELTAPTRGGLASGVIDVVLDQDPDGEVGAVYAQAKRLVLGEDAAARPSPIGIGVFLRDNLR